MCGPTIAKVGLGIFSCVNASLYFLAEIFGWFRLAVCLPNHRENIETARGCVLACLFAYSASPQEIIVQYGVEAQFLISSPPTIVERVVFSCIAWQGLLQDPRFELTFLLRLVRSYYFFAET